MSMFLFIMIVGGATANLAFYWIELRVVGRLKLYRSPFEMLRTIGRYKMDARTEGYSLFSFW